MHMHTKCIKQRESMHAPILIMHEPHACWEVKDIYIHIVMYLYLLQLKKLN